MNFNWIGIGNEHIIKGMKILILKDCLCEAWSGRTELGNVRVSSGEVYDVLMGVTNNNIVEYEVELEDGSTCYIESKFCTPIG
jgi:hypothetical protein